VRSIDLVEIGAGGGSIARVELGTIRVGPESAGSSPGPACYGRGGEDPTVTDANLVLGYLSPSNFAGGSIRLDLAAARRAIQTRLAEPLGITLEEAAWGIHALVNLNMELATRVVSIERGHDPRELALVATGGSGPVHACRLVQALGVRSAVIPAAAGVASALGLLGAEVKFDVSRTFLASFGSLRPEQAEAIYEGMAAEARQVLGTSPVAMLREVDLRYAGQGYELTVPYETARESFDALYARRYGLASPGEELQVTTWRLTAIGETREVRLPEFQSQAARAPATRPAFFPELGGYAETPVHRRHDLSPGQEIAGPAVIEERESTTVLPPGMRATVDGYGSLLAEAG